MIHLDDLTSYLQRVKVYDGYVTAVCPFHDDHHPSLMVFKPKPNEMGWFQCMTCEARGTHEYLYNHLSGSPIRILPQETTRWERPFIPEDIDGLETLVYSCHNVAKDRPHLRWYWKMRGVDGLFERCVLGWYNGWYTIPVFNNSNLVKLILRAGEHIQQRSGERYYTSKGLPTLFVPDWDSFKRASTVAICFGAIDALALLEVGIPACTSTAGKASFKAEWLAPYPYSFKVIPDDGEEETAMKLCKAIGARAEMVSLPYTYDTKDPADYLKQGKKEELEKELARYF